MRFGSSWTSWHPHHLLSWLLRLLLWALLALLELLGPLLALLEVLEPLLALLEPLLVLQ